MDNFEIILLLFLKEICQLIQVFKAALSVTFDLLILELMILFLKNTVKKYNSAIHFTNFVNLNKLSVLKQQHLCYN